MTRRSKSMKSREKRKSHFTVHEVTMKALNDPLPPHHPGTDEEVEQVRNGDFRYFDLDLSKLARPQPYHQESYTHDIRGRVRHPDFGGSNQNPVINRVPPSRVHSAPEKDYIYPKVSNETRRLLQEVEKVKRTYHGRTVTATAADIAEDVSRFDPLNFHLGPKHTKQNRPRRVARFSPDRSENKTNASSSASNAFNKATATGDSKETEVVIVNQTVEKMNGCPETTTEPERKSRPKVRIVARVPSVPFGNIPQSNIKREEKDSNELEEDENKENIVNVYRQPPRSKSAESTEDKENRTPTKRGTRSALGAKSPASVGSRRSRSTDDEVGTPPDRQKLREIRKQENKPWRGNMKSLENLTDTGNQGTTPKKETDACDEGDDKETDVANSKPWRKNMKKQEKDPDAKAENLQPEDLCRKKRERDDDRAQKVRTFMKEKRDKQRADEKTRLAEEAKMKETIRKRLLALEAKRRGREVGGGGGQSKTSLASKAALRKQSNLEDLNETEKAQRKQAEAENLRRLLVQLTTEMRAKHSPGSGGDKVSTSPFKEFESIRSEEIQIGRNRNSTFTNDGRTLAESDADDHDKQEIRYSRGSSNQQSRQVRPIISRGNNNNDAVEPNRDTAATAASFENPPSTSSAPRTHDGKSEIEAVRAPQQSDLATPSSSASVSVFDEVDFRWPSTDTKSRQQQPASSNVEAVEVDVIVKEEIADSSEDLSQTVKQLYKSHAENLDLIQRADPDLVVPPLSIPEAKEKMRSPVFKRDPTSTKSAGLDQRNKMAADNAICPSQQDPFNFMSTVQRKLDTQKQFDKPKEVDKSLMLSEGPLSSASSTTSSSAHDKSQTSTSKGHVSAAHKRRPSIEKAKGEEEEIPVRDTDPQEDRQKTSQLGDYPIPEALHMRFQAELNQFVSIQEAERQLSNLDQIRDVTRARQDAATMATLAQGMNENLNTQPSRNKNEESTSRGKKIGGEADRSSRRSSRGNARPESRLEFEARMKKELHDVLNSKMERLMRSQVEATKMTAEAARQLANIHASDCRKTKVAKDKSTPSKAVATQQKEKSYSNDARATSSSKSKLAGDRRSMNEVPDEVMTLMSRAESSIPEVLSLAEKTEKSGNSIQRTISKALQELSSSVATDDQRSIATNITEEIAEELSDDATLRSVSHRSTSREASVSREIHQPGSQKTTATGSTSSTTAAARLSEFTGSLFYQHMEDQRVRDKQQLVLIRRRERQLLEDTNRTLDKIARQKAEVKSDDEKHSRLCEKEKRARRKYKEHKTELSDLKYTIEVAERERRMLIKQHKKLYSKKKKQKEDSPSVVSSASSDISNAITRPSHHETSVSSNGDHTRDAPSGVAEEDASQRTLTNMSKDRDDGSLNTSTVSSRPMRASSKMDSVKKQIGVTLRDPLSPKHASSMTSQRRRHSSADSEDSMSIMSQPETISISPDQSDVDIRVQALQEELKQRMRTAAKLKKEQKMRRDRLKVKEDSLKKQIEKYDQLIEQTKADLEDKTLQTLASATAASPTILGGAVDGRGVTQPQIKIPRQQSREDSISSAGARSPTSVASNSSSSAPTSPSKTAPHSSLSQQSSTDTVLASPQKPATPSSADVLNEPPVWPSVSPTAVSKLPVNEDVPTEASLTNEQNYSDDFTSSSVSSDVNNAASAKGASADSLSSPTKLIGQGNKVTVVADVTVDAICADLATMLVKDTCRTFETITSNKAQKIPVPPPDLTKTRTPTSSPTKTSTVQVLSPRSRPQTDLMLTTFDISSESSDDSTAPPPTGKSVTAEAFEEAPIESGSGYQGDFIDDDFGLSIKQEWEHLRQQELRIEQEINNLQKEVVSVPEKPPPPYTPPASPGLVGRILRRPPVDDPPVYVPSSKAELSEIVEVMSTRLFVARSAAGEVPFDDAFLALRHKPPASSNKDETEEGNRLGDETRERDQEKARHSFIRFVYDLVKDVVAQTYSVEEEVQNPPWMQQKALVKGKMALPETPADLVQKVSHEVFVAFGLEKKAAKENMIIRWSQKKRDRVDQVLVRELHAEEVRLWTNYANDEVFVKDDLTSQILDVLVNDTVRVLKNIYAKRQHA